MLTRELGERYAREDERRRGEARQIARNARDAVGAVSTRTGAGGRGTHDLRKDAQLLFWDAGTAFVTVIAGVSGGRGDGGGDDDGGRDFGGQVPPHPCLPLPFAPH